MILYTIQSCLEVLTKTWEGTTTAEVITVAYEVSVRFKYRGALDSSTQALAVSVTYNGAWQRVNVSSTAVCITPAGLK